MGRGALGLLLSVRIGNHEGPLGDLVGGSDTFCTI